MFPTGVPDVCRGEKYDEGLWKRIFTVRPWQWYKAAGLGRLQKTEMVGCLGRLRGPLSRGGAARAVFEEVTLET